MTADQVYVDPSALARLYVHQSGSREMAAWRARLGGALAVTHHGRTEIINAVYSSLKGLEGQVAQPQLEPAKPAVPIRKSVTPEFLICLEDGKKLKMLKRHLRSTYNMTPDEYRVKWGLAPDYPMVAPNYAARRSEFAKKIGLGRGAGRLSPRAKRSS